MSIKIRKSVGKRIMRDEDKRKKRQDFLMDLIESRGERKKRRIPNWINILTNCFRGGNSIHGYVDNCRPNFPLNISGDYIGFSLYFPRGSQICPCNRGPCSCWIKKQMSLICYSTYSCWRYIGIHRRTTLIFSY